jgi:hypothetical protein
VRRLVALVVLLAGAFAHAQGTADYATLVRMYIAGAGNDALTALVRWPHGDVSTAAKAAEATLPPRTRIAAAVLHTEAAVLLVDQKPFDAVFHVETARALLRSASQDAAERERLAVISRRWYYFVATVFTSATQMRQAEWYVRDGLLEFPREPALYLARGAIAERTMRLAWNRDLRARDLVRELPMMGRDRGRIEDLLKRATAEYLHALTLDPHYALAHLHIGWLRLLLGDGRARPELQAAATDTSTTRVRYLAHLFLGGLAEREQRFAAAREEYEAALVAGRGFQTAYMALSRAEEAQGRSVRARELAEACAQLRKDEADPWWDFTAAFDRDALDDLRMEARRQ